MAFTYCWKGINGFRLNTAEDTVVEASSAEAHIKTFGLKG